MKTEPGEPGDSKPNLRRRMGSLVVKPEPGRARIPVTLSYLQSLCSTSVFHLLHVTIITLVFQMDTFFCCLAEKEIPILVKQEPVEIREPTIEADKFKSRYKKFIPPVLPSPVSWIIFSSSSSAFSPWLSWLLKVLVVAAALLCRWIWSCVWFVAVVEKRTVCYCVTAVTTATTLSA